MQVQSTASAIPSDANYSAAFNPLIKVDVNRPNTEEVASAATDLNMFQGWLPVMENLDEVLNQEAGGDLTVYDRIGRDPRVASSLRTRSKAVVAREWKFTPYSQEKPDLESAEYATKVFQNFPYDLFRRSAVRGGVLKGYAVGEVMWDYSEGDTFIDAMRYRHQRRFRYAPNGDLHLLTLGNPYPGINATRDPDTGLLIKKFQTFTFGDEVTTPYGNGLGQELYWPWFFKRNGIKSWMIYSDKFASPTAAGEYPAGTDKDKQQALLSAAASIHSNSAIVYPQGMSLKLIEAMRSGSVDCYEKLCKFMNEEMTISILGQLATTSGTPGKLGNSQEQEAVYLDYIKDDADSLCEAQNDRKCGVVPWLIDYQFPGLGRYPKVEIACDDEEDGKTLAERDKSLADAMKSGGKYRLGKSYWMRNYKMDKEDLEEIEAAPAEPSLKPADPAKPSEVPAKTALEFAEGGDAEPDNADLLAERLMTEAKPHLEKWLATLRGETDAAGNLVDLRQDLLTARADLAPMAATIRDAILIAELLGRAEVLDEIEHSLEFAESPIASALKLPFQEAISFFRAKVSIPTEKWNDLFLDAHSKGFMIAGAMKGELLQDLRDSIDQVISQGLTLADFRKTWDAIVERHGWSYVGGRNWRTRIVYETNTRQAYNAARWQQVTDPDVLKTRPYLLYRHGDSVRPRPPHVAWDNTVLPADDIWWATHAAANGWGCKCKIFSVGERDIARMEKPQRTAPDDGTYQWTDKQGREFTIPNGIDPGFQYNPGAAAKKGVQVLEDRINALEPDIRKKIKAEIAAQGK